MLHNIYLCPIPIAQRPISHRAPPRPISIGRQRGQELRPSICGE